MILIPLFFRILRAPDRLLAIIAAANTLFFASFLIVLMMATSQAKADDIICAGSDLRQSLSADVLKNIAAEAAKTPNGENRLWKIEKPGVTSSYLFGTMHMTDPRVIDLTREARQAYEQSTSVVIETTDVLDEKKSASALLSRPDLMMFTDQTTLSSLLEPDRLKLLEEGLKKRGLPLVAVNKMKPWMIAGLLALPACELKRKKGGAPFLDIKLAKDAEAAGKPIYGLESMVEQLDAMAALPVKFHLDNLVDTVALGDVVEDVMETMLVLYTEGRISTIMPLLKHISPEDGMSDGQYGDFEEVMIHERNKLMAKRAEKHLAQGNSFIAVGALHLPGEKGLVELLRSAGYTLTAVAR